MKLSEIHFNHQKNSEQNTGIKFLRPEKYKDA